MWGEAPEWPDYFRGGSDRCLRLDVATPIDSPSRGLTLDHSSDFASACSSTSFGQGVGYIGQVGARFVLTKRTRTRKFAALRSRSVIRESRPTIG